MSATPRGDLPRNEGRRNYPYGPTAKHARKTIFNLGSNTPNKYAGQHLVTETRVDLAGLNRNDLRALCKERKVKGWGKMTTAQMRDALGLVTA